MIKKIDPRLIIYEKRIQGLCKSPFYGHPKGCPNYGKQERCPPNQPLINKILDLNSALFVIYTEFFVGKFAERMRKMHPEWKNYPRQLYNPRRWQPTARKEHNKEIYEFLKQNKDACIIKNPEAHGVNLTRLMKELRIILNWEWPPKHNLENKVYLISLAGSLITK